MVQLIPILPRSGLYLPQFGYADDRRFARIFRETWLSLPLWARRRMLRHWREDSRRVIGDLMVTKATRGKAPSECPVGSVQDARIHTMISPKIELLPGWYGSECVLNVRLCEARELMQPLGQVLWGGHVLRFWSEAVGRMPDDIVRRLIAHELAHVFQHAVGYEEHFGYIPDHDECELHTEEMADFWGFNGEAIHRWADEEGIIKVITPS